VTLSPGKAVFVCLLLAFAVPRAHAETVYALEEIGLRSEPDASGAILQTVPRGTAMTVLGGHHRQWLRVAAPGSGYALFVEVSRVGAVPPPPLPAPEPEPVIVAPAPVTAVITPAPVPAPKAPSRPAVATAAPKTAPPAVPPGKGRSKLPFVIGGGALLAGGGAALAVAGGSSGSAPPPTTPAPVGPPTAVIFVSSDVPRRFPDGGATASALVVSGLDGTITDVRVTVNVTTSCGRDLALRLAHPDGTEAVLLFQGISGCTPTQLSATFPTERPPYEPLARFFGKTPSGAWSLRASDVAPGGGAGGIVSAWSLALTAGR
jgi:subtilisin-like proprotein convertase family protein